MTHQTHEVSASTASDELKPHVVLIQLGELGRPWSENKKSSPSLSGDPYDLYNGSYNGEAITVLVNQVDSPNASALIGDVVRAMVTYKTSPNTGVISRRFRLMPDHHQTLAALSIPIANTVDISEEAEEHSESVWIEWNASALQNLANLARTAGATLTISPVGTIEIGLKAEKVC